MADPSLHTDTPSNKNKPRGFSCEPQATDLVIKIQDGKDVDKNMEELLGLIRPFIFRIVFSNLQSSYTRQGTDDVVQEFILKHIVDNNPERRSFICLYKYERSRGIPFCGYISWVLHRFCKHWDKKICNETNHRGPSLNADDRDEAEQVRSSQLEYEISIKQSELDEAQQNFKERIRLLAPIYLKFFNAVNSLDKEKTYGKPFHDGERVVNEQKLLAFHIRFINLEFRGSPKSRDFSIDRYRAFPFAEVNHENNDYLQEEVFRVTMDFMKLLEERIGSRNLTDVVFLPPEKNIRTTVNEWIRTMKKRTDAEYAKLKADIGLI
jgi:hypothetical protein